MTTIAESLAYHAAAETLRLHAEDVALAVAGVSLMPIAEARTAVAAVIAGLGRLEAEARG